MKKKHFFLSSKDAVPVIYLQLRDHLSLNQRPTSLIDANQCNQ